MDNIQSSCRILAVIIITAIVTACSEGSTGGSGKINPPSTLPPPATLPNVNMGMKQIQFSWYPSTNATFYRVYEDKDGVSGFTQIGGDLTTTSFNYDIATHLFDWPNARYKIEACNTIGCASSLPVSVTNGMLASIGYFKASNAYDYANFGAALAMSNDGTTMVVAAAGEASTTTGINGNQNIIASYDIGAVYVFVRNSATSTWSQQAYIKASNAGAGDQFGTALALSGDGNTLIVGAPNEASSATGVGGDQSLNNAPDAGAVYVFTRTTGTGIWQQQAYIKASNTGTNDKFGTSVGLSADGNTMLVGAPGESSSLIGVTIGAPSDVTTGNAAPFSGAVYMFSRSDTVWTQNAFIKASNTGADDNFGAVLSVSADGNTLAVDAPSEDGSLMQMTAGAPNDATTGNSRADSGAVYVFSRSSGSSAWTQEVYLKPDASMPGLMFGNALSLTGDGNVLAVGHAHDDSDSVTYCGCETDSGMVRVYARFSPATWSDNSGVAFAPGYKAPNHLRYNQFGYSVALSTDGTMLAVGAAGEGGFSTGINGEKSNSIYGSGAVYTYKLIGDTFIPSAYIKASNYQIFRHFGSALALSSNGKVLAVGADGDLSSSKGINGLPSNDCIGTTSQTNCAFNSGAVFLY